MYTEDRQMEKIIIDGRQIGEEHAPFIIAEAGINHNGSIKIAKQMIDVAKEADADAVKFQTFKAEEFCGDPKQIFTYQSKGRTVSESMQAMFKRYEFNANQWAEISNYCRHIGITFFSTPQNQSDLELLLKIGVPAIKVGSDDFTNLSLLKSYAKAGLPLILSCGMSDIGEVHQALETAGWFHGKPVMLLLCTSQYPTPPDDVHVLKLTTLQNAFPGLLVGFSDHTVGVVAASMATALGAKVFEKHFTLDHGLHGPDHWFSEEPAGLVEWVKSIRSATKMRGGYFVRPTVAELEMRVLARRSIVALCDIKCGDILDSTSIGLRRPGDGLQPMMMNQILGLKVSRDIKHGEKITIKDIQS
jgi:N,N'-diacetyllegionaminate synthase